ncbi:MAG: NYN domain-containing protein [Candidatus Omnitrophota bacterium]
MSLTYIVDGYNLIKRTPRFDHDELRLARTELFSYLECYRPHGSLKNKLVVVFDSKGDCFAYRELACSFEVVFTRGETADEKIKSIVSQDSQPKEIVVVTDDKQLRLAVRSCGAKVLACSEFLKKGRSPQVKQAKFFNAREFDGKGTLNIVQKEKITEELGRIWLKKK